MKPFSAWIAMSVNGDPMKYADTEDRDIFAGRYEAFTNQRIANRRSPGAAQRVLIIADTEDNRKKLGIK